MKQTYKKIWVKAKPCTDPMLIGKECVRMSWEKTRKITCDPIELDKTPDVERMLMLGDIVEVEQ